MRIVNIMLKALCFRLNYSVAAAGISVLFYCGPLWGSVPNLHLETTPVLSPNHYEDPLTENQMNRSNNRYLCKRGASNQRFQQWQDLSPEEQKKMRRKYQEWQSLPPEEKQIIRRRMNQLNRMPPQKRKLYRQLYRQWQRLPPEERKQLQQDLDNWHDLSPQQQNSIRRRFKN